jgi:hypothetical protein
MPGLLVHRVGLELTSLSRRLDPLSWPCRLRRPSRMVLPQSAVSLGCPADRAGPYREGPEHQGVSATDGDRAPRSALGPCRNGRARASAVTNGRPRFGRTAGHGPFGSGSWANPAERFRLWSRKSGLESLRSPSSVPAAQGPYCAWRRVAARSRLVAIL